jgi:hypothetical protein
MSNVVNLSDKKFEKVNAGKIVKACDEIDKIVSKLIFEGDVPPSELLPALCQRIGVYLSCTDADKERVAQKLAKIIYKYSKAGS